jgi:hypothetical protein
MERMTSEEAYREYRNRKAARHYFWRKLEVYDADEVDREIKRLREAFQRERDEKEACVRHSEKTIERLREALKDIADGRLDDIPATQAGFVTSLQRVAREALKEEK